jgi:hypothetical protein
VRLLLTAAAQNERSEVGTECTEEDSNRSPWDSFDLTTQACKFLLLARRAETDVWLALVETRG